MLFLALPLMVSMICLWHASCAGPQKLGILLVLSTAHWWWATESTTLMGSLGLLICFPAITKTRAGRSTAATCIASWVPVAINTTTQFNALTCYKFHTFTQNFPCNTSSKTNVLALNSNECQRLYGLPAICVCIMLFQ